VSSRCQLRKAARRDFRPAVRPASLGGKTTPNSSSTDTSHVSTDSSSDPKISPFVGNTALEQQLAGGMADGYVPLEQGSPSQTVDLTGAGDSVLSERINEIRESELLKEKQSSSVQVTDSGVLKEVLCFALPALGSVLADPLMSLVDTACVGQHSSLHLAALAPNTSVFNLFFQLFTFLGLTTANLIANNSANLPGLSKTEKQLRLDTSSRVLAHSMVLALLSGLACCTFMICSGPALLTAMGATPETLAPALSYLQIRALASPALMVANVAQGACLGQQDSWTPLQVLAVSGLVNLVLDVILISNFNMGITGAAIATTIAQVIQSAFFVWYIKRKGDQGGVPLKWHGLPTARSLKPFWEVAQTLMSRTLFTCTAFTSVSTLSAGMGFIAAASHQVALQVFWFLSFVPESLSVTAQSLIARDISLPQKARMYTHTLMRLGGSVGAILAGLFTVAMTLTPGLFSSDAAVHAGLQHVLLPGCVALYTIALAMTFDGISIGSGRFKHLPRTNLIALVACLVVAFSGCSLGFGLTGSWAGLATFTAVRLVFHLAYYAKGWSHSIFGHKELRVSPAV